MSHQNVTIPEWEVFARLNLERFNHGSRFQAMGLLGAPATGKTQIGRDRLPVIYADFLDVDVSEIGYVPFRPADYDAVEIAGAGLPFKNAKGEAEFRFTRAPLLGMIEATGKQYGVVALEEYTAAYEPEQKACAEMLDPDAHSCGGDPLPKGWIVIFTGNRAHDKAGSNRLLSHIPSRCKVFNLVFSMPALAAWWKGKNANPVALECAEAHHEQGFFVDEVPADDEAYCAPRSFYNASIDLDVIMDQSDFTGTVTPAQERYLASTIGPDAANILSQWICQRDHVPTAAEIMANPEMAKVPDQTGFQMIAANLAMGEVKDARTAEAALHYIVRLRTDLQVSLGTKLMRISAQSGWTVTDPLAAAFIAKFHQLLPLAVTSKS